MLLRMTWLVVVRRSGEVRRFNEAGAMLLRMTFFWSIVPDYLFPASMRPEQCCSG